MYGGLASAIILIILSPVVSGIRDVVFKTGTSTSRSGRCTTPASSRSRSAFFLGWLGTVLDKAHRRPGQAAEMEVRSLTGFGAEKATEH